MKQRYSRNNSQYLRPKTPIYQREFRENKNDHEIIDKQQVKPKFKNKKVARKTSSEVLRHITQKISVIKSSSNISRRSQSIKSSNVSIDPVVQSFPKFHQEVKTKHVKSKVIDLNKPRTFNLDRFNNRRKISELPRKTVKNPVILDNLPNLKRPKYIKNHMRVGQKQPLTPKRLNENDRPFSAPTGIKATEGRKPWNKNIYQSASSEITCQKPHSVVPEPVNRLPIATAQKKASTLKKGRKNPKSSNRTEIRVEGLPSSVSFICEAPDMNPQLLHNFTPIVPSYFTHIDDRSDDDCLNYEDELEEYIKQKIVEYEEADRFIIEEPRPHFVNCKQPPYTAISRRKNKNFTLSNSIFGSINPARNNLLEQDNVIMEEPSIESLDGDKQEDVYQNEPSNERVDSRVKEAKDFIETDETSQDFEQASTNLSEEVNRVLFKAIFALSQCERETEQNNLLVRKILEQLEDVNIFYDACDETSSKKKEEEKVEEKKSPFKNIGPDGTYIEELDANLDIQDLLFELYGGNQAKDEELETRHNSRESVRRGHFTLSEGSQNSSVFQTCRTHLSVDNKNVRNNSNVGAQYPQRSYTKNPITSVVEKLSPTGHNYVENVRQYENDINISDTEDLSSRQVQSSCENISTFTEPARISGITCNDGKKDNSGSQFPETKNSDNFQVLSQETADAAETMNDEIETFTRSSFPEKVGEPKNFECFTNWEEGPILHIPRKISSIFASYIGESLASLRSPRLSSKEIDNREEAKMNEHVVHESWQPATNELRESSNQMEDIEPSTSTTKSSTLMRHSSSNIITLPVFQISKKHAEPEECTLAPDTSANSNMERLGRDIKEFRETFGRKVLDSESSSGLSDISMTSSDLLEESKLAVERILKCMQSCSLDSNADWSLSRQSSINDLVQNIDRPEQSGISVENVQDSMSRYMPNEQIQARCMLSSEGIPRKRSDDTKTEFRASPFYPSDHAPTPKSKINERVMKIIIDLLGKDND